MALAQEQVAAVQAQVPVVGLLAAFYRSFGEDALQVSKDFSFQLGKQLGENIKQVANIARNDANAVAATLNSFLTQASGALIGAPQGNGLGMVLPGDGDG